MNVSTIQSDGSEAATMSCGTDAVHAVSAKTPNELCNRELCQASAVLRDECLDIVTACLNEPNANRDECAIVAGEKCAGG